MKIHKLKQKKKQEELQENDGQIIVKVEESENDGESENQEENLYCKDLFLQCECIYKEFEFVNKIFDGIVLLYGERKSKNEPDRDCVHHKLLLAILTIQKEVLMTEKPFDAILEERFYKLIHDSI